MLRYYLNFIINSIDFASIIITNIAVALIIINSNKLLMTQIAFAFIMLNTVNMTKNNIVIPNH